VRHSHHSVLSSRWNFPIQLLIRMIWNSVPYAPHTYWHMIGLHVSGVGAQSAAPGPSRKYRPPARAVMLYLWRHHAQSTMVWSFVFEDHFARTFAKFSVNCRLLNLPEHHAAGPNAQLLLAIATTWWYQQSTRTGNNYYKQKTLSWTVSKLKKDHKTTNKSINMNVKNNDCSAFTQN